MHSIPRQRFVGEHDFVAFANNAPDFYPGECERSTTRTIRTIDLRDRGDGNADIVFELDGALYKMLRNVVGTAVAVASGKLSTDHLDLLLSGDARRVENPSKAAPACGLCLDRVLYDDF